MSVSMSVSHAVSNDIKELAVHRRRFVEVIISARTLEGVVFTQAFATYLPFLPRDVIYIKRGLWRHAGMAIF